MKKVEMKREVEVKEMNRGEMKIPKKMRMMSEEMKNEDKKTQNEKG